jgi:large subunit ribosomal protein L25
MAVLKVNKREGSGSRQARVLRRAGGVPGVVYGHREDVVSISIDEHDLREALRRGERLLEIELDGAPQNVLVKEVQWDALGRELLHVDLGRVDLDERVKVTVPVVLRGTPVGAARDGVLNQVLDEVAIECTVRSIPDEIRIQVNQLDVGDSLHARDLPLPEGAKLLVDPDALVCSVNVIAEEAAAPAVEEAAAPEVLTERKEEPQPEEGQ